MTRRLMFVMIVAAGILAPWAAPAPPVSRDAAATRKTTPPIDASAQDLDSFRQSEIFRGRRDRSIPDAGRTAALNYIATMDPTKLSPKFALIRLETNHAKPWEQAMGAPTDDVLHKASGMISRHDSVASSVVSGINVNRKIIALTFDDGPHQRTTKKLVGELKDLHVAATFFLVGSQVTKHPDLAKYIADAGFSIGNHTYDHVRLDIIPQHYLPTELLACSNAIKSATRTTPYYYRPPKGEHTDEIVAIARQAGFTTILWTDNSRDLLYDSPSAVFQHVISNATPGGIVLFHDGSQLTLTALPEIVHTLRGEGYEFVTIDQLLKERPEAKPEPNLTLASKPARIAHG